MSQFPQHRLLRPAVARLAAAVAAAYGLASPWSPALAQATTAAAPTPPSAATPVGGGIKWTFDGELSQGAIWRTSSRNPALVGPSNGGRDSTDLADDGNLNSNRGKLVSAPTILLGTVEAEAGRHRVLLRGSAVHDAPVVSTWRHWGADPDSEGLKRQVRNDVGRRARLLDAYYATSADLDDAGNVEFKLGRQSIVWGEAKFLQGGINMFNPVQAWKTHAAGISLKEFVLPVAAAQATWQLNAKLTLQGFYQLERAKFEYDPVGTFFSDIDLLGKGAGNSLVVPFAPPLLRGTDSGYKRKGQYGVAAFTQLDDWGLGFYFTNLTQRAAKVSGQGLNGATSYFHEWPSDVKTLGMSFVRGLGTAALSGEIAVRHGMPIGLDPAAVGAARTGAALCGAVIRAPANCGVDFALPPFSIRGIPPLFTTPLRADANGYVKGWTRVNQVALNLGLTQAFSGSDALPKMLGANGGALFLEANAIHSSLPDPSVLPTAVKDRWHGSVFSQLSVNYLRVAGSNVTITPRLIVQTWILGDDPTQAPFFKGRWAVSPAVRFHREQAPDLSLEIAYTSISDHGSRGLHALSDRDYFAVLVKYAF